MKKEKEGRIKEELRDYKALFEMLNRRLNGWTEEWRKEDKKARNLISPDSIALINWKMEKVRQEERELLEKAFLSGDLLCCDCCRKIVSFKDCVLGTCRNCA